MVKVRVHPNFVVSYYAFYLEGLGRTFGFNNVEFGREGFPEHTEFNDGFAFSVSKGPVDRRRVRRFYVSANDFARYDRLALAWCDRYGIVNHDPGRASGLDADRIVPIGPSFGVRDWGGLIRTSRDLAAILRSGGGVFSTTGSRHGPVWWFRNSRRQFVDRLPERAYRPGSSDASYVFFVSWAWKQHPGPNHSRARYMRACRAIRNIRFEGGFAPRRQNDIPGIEDLTAERMYPFREWMERTKRSCIAFNTPAVHDCLGWKLGEFLALGKAILSLPLTRALPKPLNHGEHVHYVADDQDAIEDAARRLLSDEPYRSSLERAARRYYLEELAPERVIRRIVGA
jgi:glycosyltransferase involved in cell wall biosynthesis